MANRTTQTTALSAQRAIGRKTVLLALTLCAVIAGQVGVSAQTIVPPPASTAAPTVTPAAPATSTEPTSPAPAAAGPSLETPAVGTPTITAVSLPRDLSPWGMFIHADLVVKSIMIGLVLASIVTWTIWLAKLIELASAKRRVSQTLRMLATVPTLDKAASSVGERRDAAARLITTAQQEVQASPEAGPDSLKERTAWLLARVEAGAGRQIGRGMGVLASVGAISPFVGLFGTVWGIMNSFIGISQANTTNLAVVAPGIAEALLATALGLVAAIPAVVMYNAFARAIGGYRAQLSDASTLVMRLVSRDCDTGARHYRLSRAAE